MAESRGIKKWTIPDEVFGKPCFIFAVDEDYARGEVVRKLAGLGKGPDPQNPIEIREVSYDISNK